MYILFYYLRTKILSKLLCHRTFINHYHSLCLFFRKIGLKLQKRIYPDYMNKEELMNNFHLYNKDKLSSSQIKENIKNSQYIIGKNLLGMSTGTSGNRGVYVLDKHEKDKWTGTMLAKTLPLSVLIKKPKIGLVLPIESVLYDTKNKRQLLPIKYFDLFQPSEEWEQQFVEFNPDVIIGSPHIIKILFEKYADKLTPSYIYSAAEVLEPETKEFIQNASGLEIKEIYMATEGLFAVSCSHNKLHLCEDIMSFKLSDHLNTFQFTDLIRKRQTMVNYEMNDLIEISHEKCLCGQAYHIVKNIAGRADDICVINDTQITPDLIRNTIVDSCAITDFYFEQIKNQYFVHINDINDKETIQEALQKLAIKLTGKSFEMEFISPIQVKENQKLRRIKHIP